MKKILDLNRTIYDLVNEYPEVADIMKNLGFEGITNPAMLHTAGRFMTLKKGAVMKNIDLKKIMEAFEEKGFITREEDVL